MLKGEYEDDESWGYGAFSLVDIQRGPGTSTLRPIQRGTSPGNPIFPLQPHCLIVLATANLHFQVFRIDHHNKIGQKQFAVMNSLFMKFMKLAALYQKLWRKSTQSTNLTKLMLLAASPTSLYVKSRVDIRGIQELASQTSMLVPNALEINQIGVILHQKLWRKSVQSANLTKLTLLAASPTSL